MTILTLAILFFVLLGGVSWVFYRLLDKTLFAAHGEEALARRTTIEGSHVWWLTSVVYIGFVGLCYFMISTALAVELYLTNYTTAASIFFTTGLAAVAMAVTLYIGIRAIIGICMD